MIMSSPNETERRQIIRDTWLKLSTKGRDVFIPIFPVGTKLLLVSIIILYVFLEIPRQWTSSVKKIEEHPI